MLTLLKKARAKIGLFNLKRAFGRLQKTVQNLDPSLGIDELVDFSFTDTAFLMRPFQIKEEIRSFCHYAGEKKARYILEIGTANGGTLFLHCRIAADDAVVISIDLPEGPFGGGYKDWKIPFYKSFAKKDQQLHLLRENSHDKKVFEKVKNILGNNQLDYLFIDGDHTYNGVKADYEMYKTLLKPGGFVGFHDINYEVGANNKVYEFWRDLKKEGKVYKEFIQNENITNDCTQSIGIGVIVPEEELVKS